MHERRNQLNKQRSLSLVTDEKVVVARENLMGGRVFVRVADASDRRTGDDECESESSVFDVPRSHWWMKHGSPHDCQLKNRTEH